MQVHYGSVPKTCMSNAKCHIQYKYTKPVAWIQLNVCMCGDWPGNEAASKASSLEYGVHLWYFNCNEVR